MNLEVKPLLALLCTACLLTLASCQAKPPEGKLPNAASQSAGVSQSEPEAPQQKDDPPQPKASAPAPDADPGSAARAAYIKVLEDLLYRSTTPDGECWDLGEEYPVGFDDMSENTFTLADVDGDGREELVLLTRPNIYAGYRGYVLDYDPDMNAARIQFDGFPSFTFYSNGTLAEDDSHAQGSWTDEFWPHCLYRYLPETDSYEPAGHIGAWEKEVSDSCPDSLPPFPTEKDTSGAGILYYITPAEDMGSNFTGYSKEAVDQSVYLEWLEPCTGGAQPLELEYLPLTAENIQQLLPSA